MVSTVVASSMSSAAEVSTTMMSSPAEIPSTMMSSENSSSVDRAAMMWAVEWLWVMEMRGWVVMVPKWMSDYFSHFEPSSHYASSDSNPDWWGWSSAVDKNDVWSAWGSFVNISCLGRRNRSLNGH